MLRYFIITGILLLLAASSVNSLENDLELTIKDTSCTDEGIKISYAVKNNKNFTSPNVKIAFKIFADDKPIGCGEVKMNVPANSTGDQLMEITIPSPCKDKPCKVSAQIFGGRTKKYRIDNWMAECPR